VVLRANTERLISNERGFLMRDEQLTLSLLSLRLLNQHLER
jgi:hypothetical protein